MTDTPQTDGPVKVDVQDLLGRYQARIAEEVSARVMAESEAAAWRRRCEQLLQAGPTDPPAPEAT